MRCFRVDNCCFGSLIGVYRCAVAAGREKSPRLLRKSPLLFAETRQLLRAGSRVCAVRWQQGGVGSGKKGNRRARYACLRVEKMSRCPIIRPLCLPYRAEVLILHPNGTSVPFPPHLVQDTLQYGKKKNSVLACLSRHVPELRQIPTS